MVEALQGVGQVAAVLSPSPAELEESAASGCEQGDSGEDVPPGRLMLGSDEEDERTGGRESDE